jgi:hypothetical protein
MSALLSTTIVLCGVGVLPMQVGIDTHDDILLFLGFLVFCLSGVPLVMSFVVLFLNRPRWLVPPWLRHRRGMLGDWREARRAGNGGDVAHRAGE